MEERSNPLYDLVDVTDPITTQERIITRKKKGKLTRTERLDLRNKKILRDLALGVPRAAVQEEYHLCDSSIRKILQNAYEGLDEWYKTLSRQGMISLFRDNTNEVFQELQTLKELRGEAEDTRTKFSMTGDIITKLIDYNKMIVGGPVLSRMKELSEQMEESIEKRDVVPTD